MNHQCGYCGAPLRGRQACIYCGSPAPPPEAATVGGAAVCVCQVLAQTRCAFCDTPVCAGHVDAYWRGYGEKQPSEDGAERAIWDWATSQPAALIWGTERIASPQACTVCRSINAEQALERYRQRGAPATDFDRQLAAYAAGVFCETMPRAPTARVQGVPTFAYLRARNWPSEPVATVVEWKHKRSGLSFKAAETDRGYLIPATPIQGAALNPTGIMMLEARCVTMLLGLGIIVGQAIDGGQMFFHPPTIQRLATSPEKHGTLTLSGMMGVSDAQLDADQPLQPAFQTIWPKVLVSLAGVRSLEHTAADGTVRLAAADFVGSAIRPHYPPQL
jgi:hypothetical protein